ncbi:MAG: hypothetical protein ABIH89_09850 [Elusimicrobiota bacterium]
MDDGLDINIGSGNPEEDKKKPEIEEVANSLNKNGDNEGTEIITESDIDEIGSFGIEEISEENIKIPDIENDVQKSLDIQELKNKIEIPEISFSDPDSDVQEVPREDLGEIKSEIPEIDLLEIDTVSSETDNAGISLDGDLPESGIGLGEEDDSELEKIDLGSIDFDDDSIKTDDKNQVLDPDTDEIFLEDIPETGKLSQDELDSDIEYLTSGELSSLSDIPEAADAGESAIPGEFAESIPDEIPAEPIDTGSEIEDMPGVSSGDNEITKEEEIKKKKTKLLIIIPAVLIAGGIAYFMVSGRAKKAEPVQVRQPVKQSIPVKPEPKLKEKESPYIFNEAENTKKYANEGITTYVFDTAGSIEEVQNYYRQKMLFMDYKLATSDYKSGSTKMKLVFSKEGKDCSVYLRERRERVVGVVSYVE